MNLYPWQHAAVDEAVGALTAGKSLAVVSPTGSGKSYMQAALLQRLPNLIVTTPAIELSLSIFTKMTDSDSLLSASEAEQQRTLEASRIFTVRRLHNQLMAGLLPPPTMLCHDEGAHTVDNTHETVHALGANCPRVMFTATYYRGTPQETKRLRDAWGDPYVAKTLKAAVAEGIISRPTFECWPLLDDETLDIQQGEFVVRQVESAIEDRIDDLCARVEALYDRAAGMWRRPTMFATPGVQSADAVANALRRRELPALTVVGDTDRRTRESVFREAVARRAALVQVRVVGEGVDLPMRVLVDLAPTMSPMLWMQRVGRVTRPTDDPPRVIVCNHNLTRHSYLWAGLIPAGQLAAAQKAWGPDWKPSRRTMARAIGLEGFGRFTVSAVPRSDGTNACLYALQTKDGLHQYAALLDPFESEPLLFERKNTLTGEKARNADGIEYSVKSWGRWKRIDSIPDTTGYVSVKPQQPTEKMLAWWQRSAGSVGLDPLFIPNAREFQTLPILKDTRLCLC